MRQDCCVTGTGASYLVTGDVPSESWIGKYMHFQPERFESPVKKESKSIYIYI